MRKLLAILALAVSSLFVALSPASPVQAADPSDCRGPSFTDMRHAAGYCTNFPAGSSMRLNALCVDNPKIVGFKASYAARGSTVYWAWVNSYISCPTGYMLKNVTFYFP